MKVLINLTEDSLRILEGFQDYKRSKIVNILIQLLDESQDKENLFKLLKQLKK